MKFTISIIFIKTRIDVEITKFMYYNYNQINYNKRNCFQLNKKIVRVYVIRINNNDNL